jgi:hypothetical protein
MRVLLPVSMVLLLALGGCPTDPPTPPGEEFLEVGSGEWRFEPIEDGAEVDLVHGSQGGWHVWISMRTEGLDPARVEMELVTEVEGMPETRERSNVRLDFQPIQDEPGMFRFVGWPAILSRPGCAAHERLSVSVTLTDSEGHTATDTCIVTPIPPTGDEPGACSP